MRRCFAQEAYDILHHYNAYDWNSRSGQAANYAGSSANAYTQTSRGPQANDTTDTTAYDTTTDQGAHKTQLKEEQLTAQKQQVQAGEVGLHILS